MSIVRAPGRAARGSARRPCGGAEKKSLRLHTHSLEVSVKVLLGARMYACACRTPPPGSAPSI